MAKNKIKKNTDIVNISNIPYEKINHDMEMDIMYKIIDENYEDIESNLKKAKVALCLTEFTLACEIYTSILEVNHEKSILSLIINEIADISVENVLRTDVPEYDGLELLAREYDKYSDVSFFILLIRRIMSHLSEKLEEVEISDLADTTSLMGMYVFGEEINTKKFISVLNEISDSYKRCVAILKKKGLSSKDYAVRLCKISSTLYKKLAKILSDSKYSDDIDVDLRLVLYMFKIMNTDWMFSSVLVERHPDIVDVFIDSFVEFFECLYSGGLEGDTLENYIVDEDEEEDEYDDEYEDEDSFYLELLRGMLEMNNKKSD